MILPASLESAKGTLTDFVAHTEGDIRKKLPGAIAGLTDFLYPVRIQLTRPFKAIRVELDLSWREILNFSRFEFFGYDRSKKETAPKLVNVSAQATCSQSSNYSNLPDPKLGVTGIMFACNVHTNLELGPWWQADFPDHIELHHLYFFHRMDRNGIRSEYIKISGIDHSGQVHPLYHPSANDAIRPHTSNRITTAVEAINDLRGTLVPRDRQAFDRHIEDFNARLPGYLGIGKKPDVTERQALAESLLKAIELSLSAAPDFGINRETARVIPIEMQRIRYVRVRILGQNLDRIGGVEISKSGKWLRSKWTSDEDAQSKVFWQPPQLTPRPYRFNLRGSATIHTFDFGKLRSINQIRVWNTDRPAAGKSLFAEVLVSADNENWTCVHDNWRQFRNIVSALTLPTLFVKSDWQEAFPRILGKLFALYRCRNMVKPVLKMVRGDPALTAAFSEGTVIARRLGKHARPLHLTKHGLQVPLIHRDEKQVMAQLVAVRDAISATGHMPILLYGTLLGAIREKDFIAHDDDLDIAVIVDDTPLERINDAKIRIAEKLRSVGLPCRAGATDAPIVHYQYNGVKIDIFVLGRVQDTVFWPHKNLKIVPERADIFLPPATIDFKGQRFHAPHSPEAACEARYGKDWQTPDPLFEL